MHRAPELRHLRSRHLRPANEERLSRDLWMVCRHTHAHLRSCTHTHTCTCASHTLTVRARVCPSTSCAPPPSPPPPPFPPPFPPFAPACGGVTLDLVLVLDASGSMAPFTRQLPAFAVSIIRQFKGASGTRGARSVHARAMGSAWMSPKRMCRPPHAYAHNCPRTAQAQTPRWES